MFTTQSCYPTESSLFGFNPSHRDLHMYAYQIENKITHRASELVDLTKLLDTRTYYFKTHYPDEHCPPLVPSEHYDSHQAQQAEETVRIFLEA